MANRGGFRFGWQTLVLWLILGGIAGSLLGDAIIKTWPGGQFLGRIQNLGFAPFTLDLGICSITLGLVLHVSVFSFLGLLIAYIVFRKL